MSPATKPYVGRFAPSPTGMLHAGSLVAAMASYLDAKAHHGRWLIRIEDVDRARTVAGAAIAIVQTLAMLGMDADGDVVWQSGRDALYQSAFDRLQAQVFPCACSRREIADSATGADSTADAATIAQIYPGTCRHGMAPERQVRAWRMRVPATGQPDDLVEFRDRALGWQSQYLSLETGDFVLRRADGFWAYQLAVVVDDAAQGITHVVRGMDLLDSTPRQIYLQRMLGYPTPAYLHAPLVHTAAGEKLSKQTGALALDLQDARRRLCEAAAVLGLAIEEAGSVPAFWRQAIPMWAAKYGP